MKAHLESADIPGRGIILIGETAAENEALLALMSGRRPHVLHTINNGTLEVIIAPYQYETAVSAATETRQNIIVTEDDREIG